VSHSQPLTNKELEDLASLLTQTQQQREQGKPVLSIEARNLQEVFDKCLLRLGDTDPDCERSCPARRGASAVLQPYYHVLQESRRQAKQTTFLPYFKKKSREPPTDPKTTEYDPLDPENPQPGHSSRQ
jgi:hypothetical protein